MHKSARPGRQRAGHCHWRGRGQGLGGRTPAISIARALLRRPDLLIFDEATSSLDSLTEEEISETVREISARDDMSTILIAHRLSTVLHADRIYVLERGKIVESGRHQQLLEDKGLYYAMWRQQVGESESESLRHPEHRALGMIR